MLSVAVLERLLVANRLRGTHMRTRRRENRLMFLSEFSVLANSWRKVEAKPYDFNVVEFIEESQKMFRFLEFNLARRQTVGDSKRRKRHVRRETVRLPKTVDHRHREITFDLVWHAG